MKVKFNEDAIDDDTQLRNVEPANERRVKVRIISRDKQKRWKYK